ncbi:SpoIIE family protein phosphatase, partial [Candidatus Gracilibacteria bacterium]|nr:SpoIIE family protein phosphatase [Candidatus Gracilibacteria bacterium]
IIDGKKVDSGFFKKISERLNFYKKVKQKLREKRLLDEVTMLIESQNEVDEMAKKTRLENMHMGLIKELDNDKLLGYELYAKILGKEKISGDTFGFVEDTGTYKFFLGDATGHGVQAGLIVTLLTRLFYNFSKENFLEKLVYEVNNGLKQDLKSGNFITGIFFEVDKNNLDSIKYVGMGHEPMLIYRKNTMEVEKYIAGGLAAGIRIISDINNIKTSNIKVNDGDVVFIYSDGVVESRNKSNELLGIEGFSNIIKKVCMNQTEGKITNIYSSLIEEIKDYRGGSVNFFDDATIFILKRNSQKDVIDKKSMYLKDLSMREGLSKKNVRELEGKTKEEIEKELEKIRKQKQLNLIISNLEKLYITGEVLKLKQEAIRYIKEGFIHKKINRYLKKAITNERQYKIDLKDQKMKSRYIVLKELLKKGDYYTVIKETQEIIASDGNITI